MSLLKKYNLDASHVIEYEPVEIQTDLSFVEQPVKILDWQEKSLRNKSVKLVKVLWRNPKVEESTWELESDMRSRHPHLFSYILGTESLKGERMLQPAFLCNINCKFGVIIKPNANIFNYCMLV